MIELPVCRWRGAEKTPNRYACSSKNLIVSPQGVTGEFCGECPYVDHAPGQGLTREPSPAKPSPRPERPGVVQQAVNFVDALARWIKAGRPRPSPAQLAQRKAACAACPHLAKAADKTRCPVCTCCFAGERILFGLAERPGKLDMATEQCPDNPPRWTALA